MANLFIRMRELAFHDPTLNAIFGPTSDIKKFRWFDRQIPQGQIDRGTCVAVQTVSQINSYTHSGRMGYKQDRLQFDVADKVPTRASDAAAAIDAFLDHANFSQDAQFVSPPRVPGGPPPNFKLNQRGGFLSVQTGLPIPVESLDYRIGNIDLS